MKKRAEQFRHGAIERSAINADGTIDEMVEVTRWVEDSWESLEPQFLAVFGDIEDSKISTLPSGVRVWMRFAMFDREREVKIGYFKRTDGRGTNELAVYPHTAQQVARMVISALGTLTKLYNSGMYAERISLLIRYQPDWARKNPPKINPNVPKPKPESDDLDKELF